MTKLFSDSDHLRAGAKGRRVGVPQETESVLDGLRVLVVEDEMLLALDLEEGLRDAGCVVVGPAGSLRAALRLSESEGIDAAILDVNLAGERVFPVARILASREIPYIFATAYAATEELYSGELKDVPRLAKPYTVSQAIATLSCIVD